MRNKHQSKRLQEAQERAAFVEKALGTGIICQRCRATCATYTDQCSAPLQKTCEGFERIEEARDQWQKNRWRPVDVQASEAPKGNE